MLLFFAYKVFLLILKNETILKSNAKMAARPVGLSAMLISLSYRVQFRFKVQLQPNLVSVGTQRFATRENERAKKFESLPTCFLIIRTAVKIFSAIS